VLAVYRWQIWGCTPPVKDLAKQFEALKPDMAMQFPFELDTFQKEVRNPLTQSPGLGLLDWSVPGWGFQEIG